VAKFGRAYVEQYGNEEDAMTKVKIYLKCLSQQEKEALLKLLQEAGYEVIVAEEEDEARSEEVGIAPDQGEGAKAPVNDVLVVLINEACAADPDLEKAVRRAARANCRVIGLWPKDQTTGRFPPVLEKLGSDVVTWNSRKLRDAIEEASAQWETTAGAPRAAPPTKRNRC
jgi:hypothetical protein